MRVFSKPNLSSGWKCPVCKTDEEKEVVLIGIVGTQEGYNIEAEQVHMGCLDLLFDKKMGIIYQEVEKQKGR